MFWYFTAAVLMAAGVMFCIDGCRSGSANVFTFGGLVVTAGWALVVIVTIVLVLGRTR